MVSQSKLILREMSSTPTINLLAGVVVSKTPVVNLPPVSTSFEHFLQMFEDNLNDANEIIGSTGENDSQKNTFF
jgi:hypothetical protein